MRFLFVFLLILSNIYSIAQKYTGKVIDRINNEPISFVNLGIIGKNIGTVSDINGKFNIVLSDKYNEDTIRISCIGYEAQDFKVIDLKGKMISGEIKPITLKPITYQISEVTINPVKKKTKILGNPIRRSGIINITDSPGGGAEVGIIIKLPKDSLMYKLCSFCFHLAEFNNEVIPARINIYDLKNGMPNNNILRKPIFIEINSAGKINIDLREYDIWVKEDFFISIENFSTDYLIGRKLKFYGVYKPIDGEFIFRTVSQGDWVIKKDPYENQMSVMVEYYKN